MNTEQPPVTRDEVAVRRAPKFSVFILGGAVVGFIATLIVTSLFPVDPAVGFGALVGYFSIYGVSAGVVIGALVALVLDRRSSKRARTVTVEHIVEGGVAEPDDAAVASDDATGADAPEADSGR